MKVLAIDTDSNALDFLMRCQAWGHDVAWFDRQHKDGSVRRAGEGMIYKIRDLNELRKKWLGWADLIFVCDNTYYIDLLEPFRKMGYPIVGPGVEAARMELDRRYGQQSMKNAGIPIMESKAFDDYDDAISFVKKHPHMLVSKPSGDANKALSYVAHDAGDMVYMLQRWKRKPETQTLARKEGFILQEKKLGIEMAVGAFYGPGGWSKPLIVNFENKKLMNGDLGIATGEMGTLVYATAKNKLADAVLYPIESKLRAINYVGYIDNNCIIDDAGNPWPMEWTMRPGWPIWHNIMSLQVGDPAQWLRDLVDGKDTLTMIMDKPSISVVMAIPDFPYSKLTNKEICGIPIYNADDMENIHLSGVMLGDAPVQINDKVVNMPHYVTAEDYVLVATGVGNTITDARRTAYAAIKKIKIPNSPFYRTDIGRGRLVKQLPILKKLGYVKNLEY